MYDLIGRELDQGSIFNFYLNSQGSFRLCEVVRLQSEPQYFFFDDLDGYFENVLSRLENKMWSDDYETFHYQEISRNVVVLSKSDDKFVYVYEKDGPDSQYSAGKEKDLTAVIKLINKLTS